MQELRIGQIGWGTVGASFGRLVAEGRLPARLTRVAVRDAGRPRAQAFPESATLVAAEDLVTDTDVDVVVELAGGTDAPLRWARAALEAGRPYVTANTALLATCGVELARVARACNGALLASASVGAGTPMIETLAHFAATVEIRRLRGVLNATTTYILSRMAEGRTYGDALREAQEAGFAEANPSFDVDGRDAAQKLAILASVAWGRWRSESEVERRGIRGIAVDGARAATAVRLVAEATPEQLRVAPIEIDAASAMGATRGVDNVLEIELADGSTFRIAGPGAGGDVTARAVYAAVARRAACERPGLFG